VFSYFICNLGRNWCYSNYLRKALMRIFVLPFIVYLERSPYPKSMNPQKEQLAIYVYHLHWHRGHWINWPKLCLFSLFLVGFKMSFYSLTVFFIRAEPSRGGSLSGNSYHSPSVKFSFSEYGEENISLITPCIEKYMNLSPLSRQKMSLYLVHRPERINENETPPATV
jgi:hypothetical protein